MPIPAASPRRSDTASAVLALFGQLHDEVRREIEGLDEIGLNWSPGPGMNSVATIVTHLVGSEAETLRSVAGVPADRDRNDEFRRERRSRAELLDQLHRADDLIAELEPAIGAPRLRAHLALPTLPAAE
jgi:hypothetical protein